MSFGSKYKSAISILQVSMLKYMQKHETLAFSHDSSD